MKSFNEIIDTRTSEVKALSGFSFRGDIICPLWYQHILTEANKPCLGAIVILANIIYWYRESIQKSEETDQVVALKKRFKGEFLQRSYSQFTDKYGFTKRQTRSYLEKLEYLNLITKIVEKCPATATGSKLFIKIHPENIKEISKFPSFSSVEVNKSTDVTKMSRQTLQKCTPPGNKNVRSLNRNIDYLNNKQSSFHSESDSDSADGNEGKKEFFEANLSEKDFSKETSSNQENLLEKDNCSEKQIAQKLLSIYREVFTDSPFLTAERIDSANKIFILLKKDFTVWKSLCEKAKSIDVLNGKGDYNFQVNFQWLLQENNCVKILEGKYYNKDKAKKVATESAGSLVLPEDDQAIQIFRTAINKYNSALYKSYFENVRIVRNNQELKLYFSSSFCMEKIKEEYLHVLEGISSKLNLSITKISYDQLRVQASNISNHKTARGERYVN